MVDVAALRRHDLVYIKPDAWPKQLAGYVLGDFHPDLACWAELDRPTVFRRGIGGDARDCVPLGLPLPPSMGRKRLTLACSPIDVMRTASPLLLREVLPAVPARWRPTIDALLAEGISWRCYGSLAWQHITGLPYLTNSSDLDLLVCCSSHAQAAQATGLLANISAHAPMRIDAELTSSAGAAVQWREWSSGAAELLAKSNAGATFVTREALFP